MTVRHRYCIHDSSPAGLLRFARRAADRAVECLGNFEFGQARRHLASIIELLAALAEELEPPHVS